MCKCTPSIRTPWCGKPGCEMPEKPVAPTTSSTDELRQHNELDSMFHTALMKEHAHDWSMEQIREAALICSNTLLIAQPDGTFVKDHAIEVLLDKHSRDVAVLGLKYHGYSTTAAKLTAALSKKLAALVRQDREAREAENPTTRESMTIVAAILIAAGGSVTVSRAQLEAQYANGYIEKHEDAGGITYRLSPPDSKAKAL